MSTLFKIKIPTNTRNLSANETEQAFLLCQVELGSPVAAKDPPVPLEWTESERKLLQRAFVEVICKRDKDTVLIGKERFLAPSSARNWLQNAKYGAVVTIYDGPGQPPVKNDDEETTVNATPSPIKPLNKAIWKRV